MAATCAPPPPVPQDVLSSPLIASCPFHMYPRSGGAANCCDQRRVRVPEPHAALGARGRLRAHPQPARVTSRARGSPARFGLWIPLTACLLRPVAAPQAASIRLLLAAAQGRRATSLGQQTRPSQHSSRPPARPSGMVWAVGSVGRLPPMCVERCASQHARVSVVGHVVLATAPFTPHRTIFAALHRICTCRPVPPDTLILCSRAWGVWGGHRVRVLCCCA